MARFHIYYLTSESGISGNLAWNIAHGYGIRTLLFGDHSYFACHFAFTVGLLAPLLWIWNSIGVLAVATGALMGAVPLAFFALARRKSGTRLAAWLILALTLAHPRFQELFGAKLDDSVFALPFFALAAYFLETGRIGLGSAFALLMLSTREQAPFVAFGVSLYLFFRRPPAKRAGLLLAAGSVAVFLLEMTLITRAGKDFVCAKELGNVSLWDYYGTLGGSARDVLVRALTRPWDFPLALIHPPRKLLPVLEILAHAGFLPLAAGATFLPALFTWLPHQLATPGTHYQRLGGHYSAFVLGPLLWATLHGLVQARKRCTEDRWRQLTALLLLVSGWGFLTAPRLFSPEVKVIPKAWASAVPKALSLIPPDAPVWCDPYLLPHLSMRRYVKMLPSQPRECMFETNLFLPDYVVLSLYWARTAPASGPLSRLLKSRGFETAFTEGDIVVLANPHRGRDGEPERLDLALQTAN